MQIALPKAELIALFVECILYGVFCVTFLACVYILVYRRTTERIHYPMLITAITMWCLATAHVSIDLRRILEAFIIHDDPNTFFANVHDVTHVTKSAIYITHTCVSDCLIAYRTFVVLRNKTVLLLLGLMIIGTAVAGYGSIYVLNHMAPLTSSIFATSLAPWITAFNIITAATNIIATGFIAGRIWYVNRRIQGNVLARRDLHPVIAIVVESGAVYAFSLILLTAFYTRDNNAQFIILDAVTPLIGIVFSLIIIRVGLKVSHNGTTAVGQTSTWKLSMGTPTANKTFASRSTGSFGRGGQYPMQPVAVKVSTVYNSDERSENDIREYDGRKQDAYA